MKGNKSTILAALLLSSSTFLPGQALVYAPFDDPDPTISGNTTGTGLTGTWEGSGSVEPSTLSFGDFQAGSGNSVFFTNQFCAAQLDDSLSSAGLLDDGATLWFSFLVQTGGDIATNGDLGFAIGNERIGNRNNIPVQNEGQALGMTFKNNQIRASHWSPGLIRSSANSENGAEANTLYLIAGKITWGDTSETIEIYNVASDLSLGDPVSTYTTLSNLEQSAFVTVSFGSKAANPNHIVDELRLGATSADVLPTAAGPVLDPVITSITPIDGTTYELSFTASADTDYFVRSSDVLDFENGSVVTQLTQSSVDDPGTIGPDGDLITTDENGNATFQMISVPAKNFVRLEPLIVAVP